MNPLISVIIPTYNRRQMLREAIESVLCQSFQDFEIIVVDDGSTDGSEAVKKDYPVSYLALNHSGMPGKARNQGAAVAKGLFLAFLDSDDLWLPEKLTQQMAFFEAHSEEVICHTREIWDRKGQIISQRKQKHRRQGMIFADALKKCIIGPSTVMIRREIFLKSGGFPERLQIAEDYGFWLKICSRYQVGYIDHPLIKKRDGHAGQLSHKHGEIEIFRMQALGAFLHQEELTVENRALALSEMARKCRIIAEGAEKRGLSQKAGFYGKMSRFYNDRELTRKKSV
ncbi:MAG: glycosyltransferase family 2 protein [Spirochaetales bacterium]|nr:glycosyltransferase family 2 protein [Spirochaetales bacterium]